ncbi:MAG: DNA/RNA helicase domain-containing protein, partial [Gemmataceae bacterium]
VYFDSNLHLSVSMRSYRAENVSSLVKQILDMDEDGARDSLAHLDDRYPIVLTRDLDKAKQWLREKARGSERLGIIVSSQAIRLKPLAIDVRFKPDPVHWFLADKEDIRSSYYLEDVATEFDIQGLELDWACITWDADFRYGPKNWSHYSFRGEKWQQIKKAERQKFLKNAYRVLLTRARQGMVIVVPKGEPSDPTRLPEFYDSTFDYLARLNLPILI